MKRKNDVITREMARRYKQFHNGEKWDEITLWGLFYKSEIKTYLQNGWLKPYTNYNVRCLGWYTPSKEYWEDCIKPLVYA